jgi:beta-glucosidase
MARLSLITLSVLALSALVAGQATIPDGIALDDATRKYLESLSPEDLAAILKVYSEATIGQVTASPELITRQELSFYGKSPAVYPSRKHAYLLCKTAEQVALMISCIIAQAKGIGTWADAYTQAKTLVDQMTNEEKSNITTGLSPLTTSCGGEVAGVPRLGFPGMCLTDGPNGLHSQEAVAGYASGITVGASWNKDLALARAQNMGREARRKGG